LVAFARRGRVGEQFFIFFGVIRNFGCGRLLLNVYWMSLRNGWSGKMIKNCLLDGVMISRGQFTVPCLALSYVERAFCLLIYIFFSFKKKINF
jgi:hypothetical protein